MTDKKSTKTFQWSDKRKDLYYMGKLVQSFALAVVDNPHMPDNPWNMTLVQLSNHIFEELSRMNEAGEW
jgi:hypothetical protein